MKKIYCVIINDRHTDVDVEPYTNLEDAVDFARNTAKELCRFQEDYEETAIGNHFCTISYTVFGYDETPNWCPGFKTKTQPIVMNEDMKLNWIKNNLLALAKYHKDRCDDQNCQIQLCAIQEVMTKLGIKLTLKERGILI